jgi:hypothetical protein
MDILVSDRSERYKSEFDTWHTFRIRLRRSRLLRGSLGLSRCPRAGLGTLEHVSKESEISVVLLDGRYILACLSKILLHVCTSVRCAMAR